VGKASEPPKWIKPQLTCNVDEAPAGNDWLHEIKYNGYRMHARLDGAKIQLVAADPKSPKCPLVMTASYEPPAAPRPSTSL